MLTGLVLDCYRYWWVLASHFYYRFIVMLVLRVEICAQENWGRVVPCWFAYICCGRGLGHLMLYSLRDLNHLFSSILYRERGRLSVKNELWWRTQLLLLGMLLHNVFHVRFAQNLARFVHQGRTFMLNFLVLPDDLLLLLLRNVMPGSLLLCVGVRRQQLSRGLLTLFVPKVRLRQL